VPIVRQNFHLLHIPHPRRNLPFGRDTGVSDIDLNDSGRHARRLDRLDLLDAGKSPLNQIRRLERYAITGSVFDLVPQRLKISAQLHFLAKLQCAFVADIDDAVLEELAVNLVGDLSLEIGKRARYLPLEMRVRGSNFSRISPAALRYPFETSSFQILAELS